MDRNIKLMSAINFFSDLSLWDPLAIIYFSQISGSFTFGISIFSIIKISQSIFEVPTGLFSDYYGRRNTLIAGAFCFFAATIFYAIANSYLLLIIAAIINGLGSSFMSGNNDALLYDYVSQNSNLKFEDITGKVDSFSQWALATGALLGSIMLTTSNLKLLVTISIIPAFLCFLSSLFLTPIHSASTQDDNIFAHLGKAAKLFKNNSRLRLLSISSIISFGITESAFQFRSAFVATIWPLWAVNISRLLSNLGAALSFHFSGKILNRFSHLKVLLFESIYSRLINLISLIFPSVLSPALMSTTSALFGVSTIAEKTLIQNEFSHQQRATLGSLNALASNIFFSIFALFIGFIADSTSPAIALIISNILASTSIFFIYTLFKQSKATPKVDFDTQQSFSR